MTTSTPITATETLGAQLARCDREIALASEQTDAPAWLVALGIADWEAERMLLRADSRAGATYFPAGGPGVTGLEEEKNGRNGL